MISDAGRLGVTGMSLHAWVSLFFAGVALAAVMVATVSGVRNTRGPRERVFVVRFSRRAWLVLAPLFVAICFLPAPWNYGLLMLCLVVVPVISYRFTARQMSIRESEARPPDCPVGS